MKVFYTDVDGDPYGLKLSFDKSTIEGHLRREYLFENGSVTECVLDQNGEYECVEIDTKHLIDLKSMEEYIAKWTDVKDLNINHISECWLLYGDSYESDDSLWGIFSSEKEAKEFLKEELKKAEYASLNEIDDFTVFQPGTSNIF